MEIMFLKEVWSKTVTANPKIPLVKSSEDAVSPRGVTHLPHVKGDSGKVLMKDKWVLDMVFEDNQLVKSPHYTLKKFLPSRVQTRELLPCATLLYIGK